MLGIFLIYWVGKKYYDLAIKHNRSKWGYTFLGIGIYYFAQIIFSISLYFIFPEKMENIDYQTENKFGYLAITVGVLVWYVLYLYLKKRLGKVEITLEDDIESIGKDLES